MIKSVNLDIRFRQWISIIILLDIMIILSVLWNPIVAFMAACGIMIFILCVRNVPIILGIFISGFFIILYIGELFDKGHEILLIFRIVYFICLLLYIYWYSITSKFYLNRLMLLALLMGIILLLGSFHSPSPVYGRQKAINYLLNNFLLFCGASILSSKQSNIDTVYKTGIVIGLIISISGFFRLFIWGIGNYNRLEVFNLSAIWFSRLSGLSIIMLMNYFEKSAKFKKMMIVILVFILLLSMVLANSRGPILSIFLTFTIYFLCLSRLSVSKKAATVGVILSIIFISFIIIPSKYTERYFQLGTSRDLSSLMRKVMLNNIIPVMKSNIITGIGTGGFSKLVTGGDFRIYPHNIFAELLLENGIFGLSVFGFFLFLVYKCFRILHLNVRLNSGENPYLYTAFLILIYSTLNAMVSGDIPVNEQIWFASGMLGGFYTKYQIDKKT